MSQGHCVYGGYLYVILLGPFTITCLSFTTLPCLPRPLTIYLSMSVNLAGMSVPIYSTLHVRVASR